MALTKIQTRVWNGHLPLEIRLAASESRNYDDTDPYLVLWPRLSYLPLLLPRLHAFFADFLIADAGQVDPYSGYFTHDAVPLKWHLPLGLLYDIYAVSSTIADPSPLVFKLVLHFDHIVNNSSQPMTNINPTPPVLHDSFINSVKEADFVRSGTARPIMSLSAADSKLLWSSARNNDGTTWAKIHQSLLPAQSQWRNVPLRIYLPSSLPVSPESQPQTGTSKTPAVNVAQIRVVQSPVAPILSASSSAPNIPTRGPTSSPPQTLGTALHSLLPSLFPSRRTPILAQPLLHGAPVPMSAHLEDLARWASYADGWVNLVIVLNG